MVFTDDGSLISPEQFNKALDDDGIFSFEIKGELSAQPSWNGTDYQTIRTIFNHASENPAVKGVFMHVNSPGGTVLGIERTAKVIANSSIPVVVYSQFANRSAAYGISSAADKIVVFDEPFEIIGSIGTLMTLTDESEALEKSGVKLELIRGGKEKQRRPGHDSEPTTERERQAAQEVVSKAYEDFKASVASYRGLDLSKADNIYDDKENIVFKGWADGNVFTPREALEQGLIDELGDHNRAYELLRELIAEKEADKPLVDGLTPIEDVTNMLQSMEIPIEVIY